MIDIKEVNHGFHKSEALHITILRKSELVGGLHFWEMGWQSVLHGQMRFKNQNDLICNSCIKDFFLNFL